MTTGPLTFASVEMELRNLGLRIESGPGTYRVNYCNATEATAYVTDNLEDALAAGQHMAATTSPLSTTGAVHKRYRTRLYRGPWRRR